MPYNCIVTVREIWDTRDLTPNVLDDGGALKKDALTTRFEPEDLNALEMALKIKDQHGGSVTVLSVGEPGNVDVLRESLYRGVDNVIRLGDSAAADLDTVGRAALFAAAVKKIGEYDLVLGGVNVGEGENAILGCTLAALLGLEQVSYIDNIEKIGDGVIVCRRAVEMGFEIVELKLPAAVNTGIALVKDDPRTPRSAKAALKLKMKKKPIDIWSAADLGISDPASNVTTRLVGRTMKEQKVVHSQQVDPESESELQKMLSEITK